MSDAKMEPCPFCGGCPTMLDTTEPVEGASSGDYYLMCDCGIVTNVYVTEDEVIAAWNRRALLAPKAEGLRDGVLEKALTDATAHLAGAASAYRKHAARHRSLGRAQVDPFFKTRAADFDKATDRARAALKEKPHG